MKNKLIKQIVSVFVFNLVINGGITKANLLETLQEYCVPTSSGYCSANMATYNSALSGDNKCECGSCGMYYDKTTRSCQNCPSGTYVNNKNSTECIKLTCGVGSYSVLETGKDDCDKGYYKVTISNCK